MHTRNTIFTRDFISSFLVYFLFLAAIYSLTPTLPIYLASLGSNEKEIGVLIGIIALATLVSRLFVGYALLKFSSRSVIAAGTLIAAITFLGYIAFHTFWPLLVIRFLQGVTMACIDTAVLSSVIAVVPLTYRTRALAYLMLAFSIATAVSAPFAMFVTNSYSYNVLFVSGAVLCICSLLLSWKVGGKTTMVTQTEAPIEPAHLFNPKIITPGISAFLQFFVWGAVVAFFPLYAVKCGVKNPGYFFSAMAMMMILGRLSGGRVMDTCNKEKFILAFLPSMMVILIILSLSKSLPMFILVGALWGAGASFFVPMIMSYALEYSGSTDGTAVGTFRALQDLGMAVGPVVVGTMISFTGYRLMFLSLAVICLLNVCYFQLYVRRKNHTRIVENISRPESR